MLKLKRIPIFHPMYPLIYIHESCAEFPLPKENSGIQALLQGTVNPFYGQVVVSDSKKIIAPDEVGIAEPFFNDLNLPEGSPLTLIPAHSPVSLDALKRKMTGDILSPEEQEGIIKDIRSNHYSDSEISGFLVANASFYSPQEVLSLTESLLATFKPLDYRDKKTIRFDEYSVGGVLGNCIGPVVQSLMIAAGQSVPKILNHTITSCSSMLDVMDVLCHVRLRKEEITKTVRKTSGCVACSTGTFNFSETEERLIHTERGLGIDTFPLLVSSVMARKKACGITHLLVDIPVGRYCKVKNITEAISLKKLFEYVGKSLNIMTVVVLTDGEEPIGHGVGPVLEARDVLQILNNSKRAPQDLKEKALFIAGRMLEMTEEIKGGEGLGKALQLLESGAALEAFEALIYMQGKKMPQEIGLLNLEVIAPKSGLIYRIDSGYLEKVAEATGMPRDKSAGLDFVKKTGDYVEKGETLYRVYTSNPNSFSYTRGLIEGNNSYYIFEN